eukprot:g32304.t2
MATLRLFRTFIDAEEGVNDSTCRARSLPAEARAAATCEVEESEYVASLRREVEVYPARTISPMAKQVAAPVRYGAYAMKAGVPMSPAAGPVPGHVTFGAVVMNGPGNAERGCGRCVNHSSDILTLEGFMWG